MDRGTGSEPGFGAVWVSEIRGTFGVLGTPLIWGLSLGPLSFVSRLKARGVRR